MIEDIQQMLGSLARAVLGAGLLMIAAEVPVHAETIRLGMDAWPPFRIETPKGYEGIDVDLITEVSRRMGIEFQIEHKPWGRSLKSMEFGILDVMTGLAYREERAKYILYTSTPYYACSTVFYTVKGEGKDIATYQDLKKFSVGYVLHSAYFEPFDADDSIRKVGVATEENLVDMLINKRIKTIVGTDCQVDYYLESNNLSGLFEKTAYRPGNTVNLYLGISRKSHWVHRFEEFDRIIGELVAERYPETIAEGYVGTVDMN